MYTFNHSCILIILIFASNNLYTFQSQSITDRRIWKSAEGRCHRLYDVYRVEHCWELQEIRWWTCPPESSRCCNRWSSAASWTPRHRTDQWLQTRNIFSELSDSGIACASLTFNIAIETCGKRLALWAVIEDGDPDLVPGEDDVGSGAALGDSVAAPLGLEPVVLALDGDVRAHAIHREGGGQVLEGHQQVQVTLSLHSKGECNFSLF